LLFLMQRMEGTLVRCSLMALLLVLGASCSPSDSDSRRAAPAAARPAAVAGNDQEVVPSYATAFDTAAGWTLDAAVGGVGWAVDGDPAGVPGGPARGATTSLNYNDGTDYDNTGANSGAATSAELAIAGLAAPVLVFWCNYQTDTPGAATDKRWLRISTNNFAGTVLSRQLATVLASTEPSWAVCAAMGTWHRHAVPLDPAWQKIKIRFFFETVNGTANTGGGWFLDDLSIGVQLSARGSSDPSGGAVTYLWEQTGGTAVALSDPTAMEPTFLAPAVSATPADNQLLFRLTVTGPSGTDTDEVLVQVKRFIVSANDAWFVGYGKAGLTLQAVVTGSVTAPTYEWTGFEPWLAKSGESTDLLTFSTPAVTDFQNHPDRADVAVMERTTQGRLQLTITATDGAESDSDLVNLSAGPFADSVANENVTLGEPVFLNGSATIPPSTAVTTWTWSGIKPTGAAISFFKPNKTALAGATTERFVYFVPDQLGPYEIQVELNSGLASETTKVILLTCGKYVGTGTFVGKTPDPFVGECAACHAGQFGWLADFVTPWKETGHARMLERVLDPAHPLYASAQAKGHWNDAFNFGSNYSIDSRTVGWSRINASSSGGWTEKAALEDLVWKGATWEEVVRKHPKTAALSNVQCESCHGPGSEHAGDTTAIRKSFDANVCGRCHARKQDLWESSKHGLPPLASAGGNASCNGCHTAQGFVVEMRAQEGADPHAALFAASNLNRPVIPADDRRGTTCQACHEPHKKTAKRNTPAGQMDPQLRAYGDVQFRNGAIGRAGEAAACYLCHQSRTDTRDGSPDMTVRRAPHDSTAAEMVSQTNGIEFAGWAYRSSPHGIFDRFVTPTRNENRSCLACHADVQPPSGVPGYGAVGGHTFAVRQGTGLAAATEATHPTGTAVGGTNKFTVASGATFLRSVFPGDTLTLPAPNAGTFTVQSVDGARQVSLVGASFTADAPASWTLTSVKKYNTLACSQCHPAAGPPEPFHMAARGDYDGDIAVSGPETVQEEIQGLLDALKAAIEAKLATSGYANAPATLETGSGRIKYRLSPSVTRTFPGPGVTSSDNPDISWAALDAAQQANWTRLYQAAYNYFFVTNDRSGGIHNTGYAVDLLQSSYQAVTGAPIGAPFVPYP
jgi:hypothetical protein